MLVAQMRGQQQHVSVHNLLEEGCWEPYQHIPPTEITITNCSFGSQLACSPDFQDTFYENFYLSQPKVECANSAVCPWHSLITILGLSTIQF